MADLDNIVEELSKLTVMEAADLVKQLEEKWGVSAAAPVAAVAVAGGGDGGGGGGGGDEAKSEFDVVLAAAPSDKKIPVIKAVREVKAGLGLADAKKLVEGVPATILEAAPKEEAETAKKKLEEAGATVELK